VVPVQQIPVINHSITIAKFSSWCERGRTAKLAYFSEPTLSTLYTQDGSFLVQESKRDWLKINTTKCGTGCSD